MLAHDIDDSNPQALFNQVAKSLAPVRGSPTCTSLKVILWQADACV